MSEGESKVVSLQQQAPSVNDVVATLRRIADQVEAGEIEFPVTTAVLLLGHTDKEKLVGDELHQNTHWTTFGFGPRNDMFTCRGLMITALNRWGSDDE